MQGKSRRLFLGENGPPLRLCVADQLIKVVQAWPVINGVTKQFLLFCVAQW